MLIDARTLPTDGYLASAPICIIGGGIAGITLALELAQHQMDVIVLESGGLYSDAATDRLHEGRSVGLDYQFGASHRSRFLGGGSNCWAGWCRPLEPHDFRPRPWVGESGWPISHETLQPYYDRTHAVLGLGPTSFDVDYWHDRVDDRIRDDTSELHDSVAVSFSQFANPHQFDLEHFTALQQHPFVTTFLHANLTEFQTAESRNEISAVKAMTLTGRALHVRADEYVLATGGIENARLLLTAGSDLGINHDMVGRYFMDHPRRLCGEVQSRPSFGSGQLYERSIARSRGVEVDGVSAAAAFVITPERQEQEGLLNARAGLRSMAVGESSPTAESLRRLRRLTRHRDRWGRDHLAELGRVMRRPWVAAGYVGGRYMPISSLRRGTQLELIVEPSPERDSRVTLAYDRDALGMRRAQVDWRLSEQIRHTFDRTSELMAEQLRIAQIADVEINPTAQNWRDEVEGTWHHMGTTRMSTTPRHGVVDENCRVHGIKNLYVAGSSVFPTGGANFPTMTLTALSLRLADHLIAITRKKGRLLM